MSERFDPKPVEKLLQRNLAHKEPYVITFKGLQLTINPEVFNPDYTKVSGFLADSLDARSGEACLEMFLGSGALSLLAAKQGARKVVGVDILGAAVRCAQENATNLGLDDAVDFRQGSMWEPVSPDEKFDLIFANPPLLPANPETIIENVAADSPEMSLTRAVADSPEMSLTKEFIRGAAEHINPSGRIYMAFSNACQAYVGDPLAFVEGLAKSANLTMSIKAEWDVGYEVYRILELRPISQDVQKQTGRRRSKRLR